MIDALNLRIDGQARDILILSRAIASVAAGDPGGVKATTAVRRAALPSDVSPQSPTPRSPSPARGATAARIEARPEPDVDTEGDRVARQTPIPASGDVETGESDAAVRARFEAEEDARHPDDPEPLEERTHVWRGTLTLPARPDPLAGVPLERPISSPKRAAAAFRTGHPGDTLISVGMAAAELAKIDRLAAERGVSPEEMAARLARAGITAEEQRTAALDVRGAVHCHRRPACQYALDIEPTPVGIDPQDWRSLGACECTCEGCRGATS